MSKISTHVLDTVPGKPAAGIAVRLQRFEGGGWIEASANAGQPERANYAPGDWIEVAAGITDADGRCRDLEREAASGTYRLAFDTGAYLARLGRPPQPRKISPC